MKEATWERYRKCRRDLQLLEQELAVWITGPLQWAHKLSYISEVRGQSFLDYQYSPLHTNAHHEAFRQFRRRVIREIKTRIEIVKTEMELL